VVYSEMGRGDNVSKRWTWVAWSMLAVFIVGVVLTAILAVANNTLNPVSFAGLSLGFGAFMVVGALIVAHRPSNAIERHRLDVLGYRATGIHRRGGGRVCHLRACDPARLAAGRHPRRLVCVVAVVSGHSPGAGVHSLVVPDRSAALAALVAGRLAGRGGDGGVHRAGGRRSGPSWA
jgi:hypothetical protein